MLKDYKLKSEVVAKSDGYVSQLNVKVGDVVSTEFTVGLITDHHEDKNNYILKI